jgi:hypothetical protein
MRKNVSVSVPLDGIRVFSATLAQDRQQLGDRVTDWIAHNRDLAIRDVTIVQSSDEAFHCLTIVVFYGRRAP